DREPLQCHLESLGPKNFGGLGRSYSKIHKRVPRRIPPGPVTVGTGKNANLIMSIMGKITGFMEYGRKVEGYRDVEERIKNYREFTLPLKEAELKNQGARCMDCGIPFCHSGCPLGNLIPDFNDAVYQGK